jgi:hypothetical protein
MVVAAGLTLAGLVVKLPGVHVNEEAVVLTVSADTWPAQMALGKALAKISGALFTTTPTVREPVQPKAFVAVTV